MFPTTAPRRPRLAPSRALAGVSAAALAAAAVLLGSATPASAADPSMVFDYVGETVQTFTVLPNMASIQFQAAGGGGGNSGGLTISDGSWGALVEGTFDVLPGDQLLISVGDAGEPANGYNDGGGNPNPPLGGWGGMGASGGNGAHSSDEERTSGAGGGATTIQLVRAGVTSTVAIAGGGGGAGGASLDIDHYGPGGHGGYAGSWTGEDGHHGTVGPSGGSGGAAGSEATGQGGSGSGGTDLGGNGGGGGGGAKGGAGGGGASGTSAGGGGGAGSSMVGPMVTGASVTSTLVDYSTSSNPPWGWAEVTVTYKPVPTMDFSVQSQNIYEGDDIGWLAAGLPAGSTGTVAFSDITDASNPIDLGTATIDSTGAAVLTSTSSLLQGLGVHTLQAEYSGDPSWSSTTATLTVTVNAFDHALGQPVTASSSFEALGWSAQYLTEGNTQSEVDHYGFTTDPAVPSQDSEAWVYVDFGSSQEIGAIVLVPRTTTSSDPGDVDGAGFPASFSVQVSDDATNWSTIQSYAGQTGNLGPRTYVFSTPGTGQYLRILVTELGPEAVGDDGYRFQLVGLQAYTDILPAQAASLQLNVDATNPQVPIVDIEGVDVYGTPTGENLNCEATLTSSDIADLVSSATGCSGWTVELATLDASIRTFTAVLDSDASVSGSVQYDARVTTTLSVTADAAVVGKPTVVHATVTPASEATPSAAVFPEGTVRVLEGDRELGRGALNGGRIDLAIDGHKLSAGSHTLRVEYLGSDEHRPSSTEIVVTVSSGVLAATGSTSSPAGALTAVVVIALGGLLTVMATVRRRRSRASA